MANKKKPESLKRIPVLFTLPRWLVDRINIACKSGKRSRWLEEAAELKLSSETRKEKL